MEISRREKLNGVIMGTALGDSLGLPSEGLSSKSIEKLGWRNNWKQRLIFDRGMLSDDTEHTLMVAESLAREPSDSVLFRKTFARKLRWWLVALPAGTGLATARSILKLWIGFPSDRSGVYSAGNGPAMRSAVIGAYFADSPEKIEAFVRVSTIVTHTDPKALVGALAIAYCAANADDPDAALGRLRELKQLEPNEWPRLLETIESGLRKKLSVDAFAAQLGLSAGVSGYAYHTVPVAVFSWLRWYGRDDAFERTLTDVLNCGGDTDSVGAIAGAMAGASSGIKTVPPAWWDKLSDWPRSKSYLASTAINLASGKAIPSVFFPFTLTRNLLFLLIVCGHGIVRLLPIRIRKMIYPR